MHLKLLSQPTKQLSVDFRSKVWVFLKHLTNKNIALLVFLADVFWQLTASLFVAPPPPIAQHRGQTMWESHTQMCHFEISLNDHISGGWATTYLKADLTHGKSSLLLENHWHQILRPLQKCSSELTSSDTECHPDGWKMHVLLTEHLRFCYIPQITLTSSSPRWKATSFIWDRHSHQSWHSSQW